jgi:hypothetical protein
MSQQHEREIRTDSDVLSWDEPWACTETLKTVTELNEQCLELMSEQARLPTASTALPVFRELGDLWSGLDSAARRRAATCPYLLLDAGFADPYRWRWLGGNAIADREPAYSPFFTANTATRVAQQIFMHAWFIVRTQPMGVPLYLGMPNHCATLLRSCSMGQITTLANLHSGWLRPRWAGRVKVWRELLSAAISGEGVALEKARLHGVQLLATELKALEQVNANERK